MNIPQTLLDAGLIYLAIISIIACIVTIYDKRAAKHHRWRIPEATLLLISMLGGSVAMLLIMLLIHHKTRHLKFMLGIPAIIVLQICLIYFVGHSIHF